MGTDKSVIEIGGTVMAERVAAVLEAAGCQPVVFVGGDERALAATGRAYVADRWPGEGPVGGVLSAFHAMAAIEPPPDAVVVCACDLPDLTPDAVRAVVDDGQPGRPDVPGPDVRVADSGRLEPMLACWSSSAAGRIEGFFADGHRAMHEIILLLDRVTVPVDPSALRNVNRPADLGKVRRPPTR